MSQKLSVAKKIMLNQHGRASSHILVHVYDCVQILQVYSHVIQNCVLLKLIFFFISFLA